MRRIREGWNSDEGHKAIVPQGASRRTYQAAERAYYAGAREVLDHVELLRKQPQYDGEPTAVDAYLDHLAVDLAAFEMADRAPV